MTCENCKEPPLLDALKAVNIAANAEQPETRKAHRLRQLRARLLGLVLADAPTFEVRAWREACRFYVLVIFPDFEVSVQFDALDHEARSLVERELARGGTVIGNSAS